MKISCFLSQNRRQYNTMLLGSLVRRCLSTQLLFYKGMTFLHGYVGQYKKFLTSWVGPSALPIWSDFSHPALPTYVEMLQYLVTGFKSCTFIQATFNVLNLRPQLQLFVRKQLLARFNKLASI